MSDEDLVIDPQRRMRQSFKRQAVDFHQDMLKILKSNLLMNLLPPTIYDGRGNIAPSSTPRAKLGNTISIRHPMKIMGVE